MNDDNVGVPGDDETSPLFELEPQASALRSDEERDLLWPGPLTWRIASATPLARMTPVFTPSVAFTPAVRRAAF